MKAPSLTRRAALTTIGTAVLGGIAGAGRPAASAEPEQILLIPRGPTWTDPDFMTVGIGASGHMLVSGAIPNLWMGREFVATAHIDLWRSPGGMNPTQVFGHATRGRRGRPLTLVAGDLGDPRWTEVASEIMTAARQAGRFVIAANAAARDDEFTAAHIVDRLARHCDGFIACPEIPPVMASDLDPLDQAILLIPSIEAIAGVAAQWGGRAIAARLPPGRYRADRYRIDWQPVQGTILEQLRSARSSMGTAASPALITIERPSFLPSRLEREFRRAARALPESRQALVALAYHDGVVHRAKHFTVKVFWLTRIAPSDPA